MFPPTTQAFIYQAGSQSWEGECVCVCVIMLSATGENGFAVNCCRLEKKLSISQVL